MIKLGELVMILDLHHAAQRRNGAEGSSSSRSGAGRSLRGRGTLSTRPAPWRPGALAPLRAGPGRRSAGKDELFTACLVGALALGLWYSSDRFKGTWRRPLRVLAPVLACWRAGSASPT